MFPQTVDHLYSKHLKLNGIRLFNASVTTFSLFGESDAFFGVDLAKTRIGAKRNAILREAKYFHSNQGLILSGYVAKA